jgi:hypothetical protein
MDWVVWDYTYVFLQLGVIAVLGSIILAGAGVVIYLLVALCNLVIDRISEAFL